MKPAIMQYSYSTKNFHRYSTQNIGGVPKEVYIPRGEMVNPKAEITVTVTVSNTTEVAVQVKAK